jgi:cytochrome c oxidase subunit II
MPRRVVLLAPLAAAGCGGTQSVFNPAGPAARSIATLGWSLLGLCAVIYGLVLAATVWALIRQRRDSDDTPDTEARLTRNVTVAVGVTVLTLVGIAISSWATERRLLSPSGAGAVTIDAIGHQWWWEFRYHDVSPSEIVDSPNELHLPIGVPIVIKTMSPDVIHSFWVPNLQGKRDLVPGQITHLWLQADREGVYRGQCAEFCGHQHAKMAFVVVAEPMTKFRQWLAQQRRPANPPQTAEEQRGQQVFLGSTCSMCHTVLGTPAGSHLGPDLTHVGSRMMLAAGALPNTPGHLALWVSNSQSVKPGNRMPPHMVPRSDLPAIVAYLRSLR